MDSQKITFFEDLEKNKTLNLKLIKKEKDTHDSYIFSFQLKEEHSKIGGIYPGQIRLIAEIEGEQVSRSYTIISTQDDTQMDISIKIYYKTEQFPEGGILTQYLESMQIGQEITFGFKKIHKMQYIGNGEFMLNHLDKGVIKKHQYNQINMVCGGSGVTPAIQILKHIQQEINQSLLTQPIQIKFIYCNKTKNDVMLKDLVESLSKATNSQLLHLYSLQQQEQYELQNNECLGFCTQDICKQYLHPAGNNCINFFCGPSPMNKAVRQHLIALGHQEDDMKQF